MKKIIIIISAVIILVLGLAVFGRSESQLVDVRTPEEYATGHANNAVNIPLATLQSGDFSKIYKGVSIKVYCRSGKRAAEAKVILEKAGYEDVANVGGLTDLQNKGSTTCASTNPAC